MISSVHKFRIGPGSNGAGRRRGSSSSIGGGEGAGGRVSERALSSKRRRSLCTAADAALLLEVHSAANQGRLGVSSLYPASASGKKKHGANLSHLC